MRHLFTLMLGLWAAAMMPNSLMAENNQRPNIIYILADDLGWTDTGTYGSKYYETPNVDRLARTGMKFTNYHNCQNCQPTRAALMSGQYSPRTGIYTVGNIDRFDWQSRPLRPVDNVTTLPLDLKTIADQLKSAGYKTAMFGKWHLGNRDKFHPSRRGFDEALVSEGEHFGFETTPAVDIPKGIYLADFLTDKATDFITRHKDEPFFLYLPHFGVHSPHEAKPELIERFKNKPGVGGHNNPTYAAMIYSVDESVGKILDLLERLKISDNTIVIFSSDNGGVGGYVREGIKQSGDITDNTPLRSGKGSLYEGGTRDPMIIRWPGVTKAQSTCDVPTIHIDMFTTLLDMTGAPKPGQTLDGESLVKLLHDPTVNLTRTAIYQHFPGYLGAGANLWRTTPVGTIIAGDWKLMEFFEDGRLELYYLKDDIGESKNLAQKEPAKVKELHEKLIAWRKEIGAKLPTKNDPISKPTANDPPKRKAAGKK